MYPCLTGFHELCLRCIMLRMATMTLEQVARPMSADHNSRFPNLYALPHNLAAFNAAKADTPRSPGMRDSVPHGASLRINIPRTLHSYAALFHFVTMPIHMCE